MVSHLISQWGGPTLDTKPSTKVAILPPEARSSAFELIWHDFS